MKKILLVLLSLLLAMLTLVSCINEKSEGGYQYLGDFSYDAPLIAMVYENFEGQGYGILYRRVTDFSGFVSAADRPIMLYFYTSMHMDYAGTTADIEQMAEDYHDLLFVVAIDVFQEGHIAEHYDVQTVPEFILLNDSYVVSRFDSAQREQWPNEDVREWMLEGIK